jgi:hypothetical protein
MSQTNLVLITIGDNVVQDTYELVGQTGVIVIDWDAIDSSSSLSTEEALTEIAKLKIKLYPWQEQITEIWRDLLQIETDWLDGAAHDANLTYAYGRDK